jgi:hypothetical protein
MHEHFKDREVKDHYQVSYSIGEFTENIQPGYDVYEIGSGDTSTFVAFDKDSEQEVFESPTAIQSVRWCFDMYKAKHPNETVKPVWGCSSPNKELIDMGFEEPKAPILCLFVEDNRFIEDEDEE